MVFYNRRRMRTEIKMPEIYDVYEVGELNGGQYIVSNIVKPYIILQSIHKDSQFGVSALIVEFATRDDVKFITSALHDKSHLRKLQQYQEWRTGQIEDIDLTVEEITEAINYGIDAIMQLKGIKGIKDINKND